MCTTETKDMQNKNMSHTCLINIHTLLHQKHFTQAAFIRLTLVKNL